MSDIGAADPAVRTLSLAAGGEVNILLSSSTLRIRGTDGDRVVVHSHDGGALDGRLDIEADAGDVRIRDSAVSGFRIGPIVMRTGGSPDVDVDVPRTARVAVRTMSGDVKAVAIGGASRWATASGQLLIQLDGGPASIESTSGDITVDASAPLELEARSVSGDVRIRAALLTALNASTTSGDIEIEAAFASGSSHAIHSVSGDVHLAASSDVRLETRTVTGDVQASVPHRAEGGRGRRTLVVGEGRGVVTVSTLSGDISLSGRPSASRIGATPPASQPPAVISSAAPEPAAAGRGTAVPAQVDVTAAPPPDAGRAEPLVVVAEAEAAANLIRPAQPGAAAEPGPEHGVDGATDRHEAARLEILRALERGDLDVDGATRRLEGLEEAGPRAYRRWC